MQIFILCATIRHKRYLVLHVNNKLQNVISLLVDFSCSDKEVLERKRFVLYSFYTAETVLCDS